MIGSKRHRYRAAVEAARRGVNPNEAVVVNYSPLDRLAVHVTGNLGTMKVALVMIGWTVLWLGYNFLAWSFGWPAFDPVPACVLYLLISNVIQICLMPLIMVAQNLQSRHAEAMAEEDYRTNRLTLGLLIIMAESFKDDGRLDQAEVDQLKAQLGTRLA